MLKIKTKVITILTLSSAILGIGLGVFFTFFSVNSLQKAKRDELTWMTRAHSAQLGQTFETIEDQVSELTNFVEQTINIDKLRTDENYLETIEPLLDDYVSMFAHQRALGKSGWLFFEPKFSDEPHDIYYTDSDADGIAERQAHIPFSYYDGIPTPDDDKYWYYGPKETLKGVWTNPYYWKLHNDTTARVVSYAQPIIIDGEFIGVAGSYYHFSEISEAVRNIAVFSTGFASLYNDNLDAVIHPTYKTATRNTSDNLHTMSNEGCATLAHFIDSAPHGIVEYKKSSFAAYSTLPNGWVLVLEPVAREMYANIHLMVFIAILFVAFCTLLVAAAAAYWGNRLTEPIERLTRASEAASNGDFSVRVNIKTNDEIEILGTSFNNMLNHLQRLHDKLANIAFFDEMTGLRNLSKFKIDAKTILEKNNSSQYIAIKIDIDAFKLYNQLYGFARGDLLLKSIADAGSHIVDPQTEIVAHVTADEFVFLLRFVDFNTLAKRREQFYNLILKETEPIGFKLLVPTGRYLLEKGSTDVVTMFERVNFAHHAAKSMSDPKVCDYNDSLSTQSLHEHKIERMQEHGITYNEFLLYLQPKYEIETNTVVGAEALVRWKTSDGELIFPNDFIPIFEKNGFIARLDMYMLESACRAIRRWLDRGYDVPVISINFSRIHFSQSDFILSISEIADKYAVPHALIEIELTETAIFENMSEFQRVMCEAHDAGFTVSMDDFGSGYSSLGLLKDLSVDVIKLDRSFFVSAGSVERERAVITSVIDMAHKLEIKTVAEGVESKEHILFLQKIKCDVVQGYYYAKPMYIDDYEKIYFSNF